MLERFEQFSAVISDIYRYIQNIERAEMIKYGYKGAYAQYLVAMRRHDDGVTITNLCDICGKDKAAVSRVISEMEEKSLVVRVSDNDKAYRAKLKLTDEGMRAAEFVCKQATAAVAEVGKVMNDDERRVFYELINMIADKLQILSKEGIPQ